MVFMHSSFRMSLLSYSGILMTNSNVSRYFQAFQNEETKAVLKYHLTTDVPESQASNDTMFVLDGGALLHQVMWFIRVTNSEVIAQYLS